MAGNLSGRSASATVRRLLSALVLSWMTAQKFTSFLAKPRQDDLTVLHDLMKAGKISPVVEKCYSLSEVSDALRYLQQKHARGKLVISVG